MTVQKACKDILIKEPFYGFILMSLNKHVTQNEARCKTLQVELHGISFTLVINEIFWNKLSDLEQIAVIKHELMHLCFFHLENYSSYAFPEIANVAMDMEINQYIKNLPSGCVDIDLYKLKVPALANLPYKAGSKTYYEELLKASNKNKGSGAGSGSIQIDQNGTASDSQGNQLSSGSGHDSWKDFKDMSSAEKQIVENQFKQVVENAVEQVNKSRGNIPGELSSLIKELLKKEEAVFNWKVYFRRLMGNSYNVYTKKSQRKLSKRFGGSEGLKIKQKHHILVGVDTSGSVSDTELAEIFEEIHYIYKAGTSIDIIQCDTKITSFEPYRGKWDGVVKGRGGTDFNPVIDFYNQNRSKYTTLIYCTDGEAPLDFKVLKKMVWLISSQGSKGNYPGFTIYMPKRK